MPSFRRALAVGAVAALLVALAVPAAWVAAPAWCYKVSGSQRQFNRAVARWVPRHAALRQLEAVVGPGERPPAADRAARSLGRLMQSDRRQYPDGWRDGDAWVVYAFPDQSKWWFQVRDGRLVNYDPAVLAAQPQDHVAMLH